MKKKSKSLNQLRAKYQKDNDFKAAYEERSFYLNIAHLIKNMRERTANRQNISSKKIGITDIEKKYGSLTFGDLLKPIVWVRKFHRRALQNKWSCQNKHLTIWKTDEAVHHFAVQSVLLKKLDFCPTLLCK